jgi:large subunit ribosomal protein L28
MADRFAHLLHGRGVRGPVQLLDDRFEGERHVGAGVAVGHRVHVERVEFVLMGAERVPVGRHDPSQVPRRQLLQDRHGWDRTAPTAILDRSIRSASKGSVMASVCEVCGKKPQFGMRISHSHRRTKRRWNPNVQKVRAVVNGAPKRLHVCTACLKAGKVQKP